MEGKQISAPGRELVEKRRLARHDTWHGAQIADRGGMHEQSRLPCDKHEGGGSL